MARKGKFTPINSHKYIGDKDNIVYRSSWELSMMQRLDMSANCLEWVSEEVVIPYYSIADSKNRRYYMDFYVKYKDDITCLIEVKPFEQTQRPKNTKNPNAIKTWITNICKWNATLDYCERRGWRFYIFTERGTIPYKNKIELKRKYD